MYPSDEEPDRSLSQTSNRSPVDSWSSDNENYSRSPSSLPPSPESESRANPRASADRSERPLGEANGEPPQRDEDPFDQVRAAVSKGVPPKDRVLRANPKKIPLPTQSSSGPDLVNYWTLANRAGSPVTVKDLETYADLISETTGRDRLLENRRNPEWSHGLRDMGEAFAKQNPKEVERNAYDRALTRMKIQDNWEDARPELTADLAPDTITAKSDFERNMKRFANLKPLPNDASAAVLQQYRAAARAIGVRLTTEQIAEHQGDTILSRHRKPGAPEPMGVAVLGELGKPREARTLLNSDPKQWANALRERQQLPRLKPDDEPSFSRSSHSDTSDVYELAPTTRPNARDSSDDEPYSRSPETGEPRVQDPPPHTNRPNSVEPPAQRNDAGSEPVALQREAFGRMRQVANANPPARLPQSVEPPAQRLEARSEPAAPQREALGRMRAFANANPSARVSNSVEPPARRLDEARSEPAAPQREVFGRMRQVANANRSAREPNSVGSEAQQNVDVKTVRSSFHKPINAASIFGQSQLSDDAEPKGREKAPSRSNSFGKK